MENVTGGFGSQGGSTITQQVVKNYFLTMDKTAKRKVQEWYLSYKLEQQYSKHEILEMYLNKINLGNRSYGIATAAQKYYGKDLKTCNYMKLLCSLVYPKVQTFTIQRKRKMLNEQQIVVMSYCH